MTARRVSQAVLEQLWFDAAEQGKDCALILGDPNWDVLEVGGREVARAPKPVSLHV